MNNIYIYPCGTPVTIKHINVPGIIIGATIREGSVSYHVAYHFDGHRQEPWLYACEFEVTEGMQRREIGFGAIEKKGG